MRAAARRSPRTDGRRLHDPPRLARPRGARPGARARRLRAGARLRPPRRAERRAEPRRAARLPARGELPPRAGPAARPAVAARSLPASARRGDVRDGAARGRSGKGARAAGARERADARRRRALVGAPRRRAWGAGERVDRARHHFYTEVKGVTYHQLALRETAGGWWARIILDV